MKINKDLENIETGYTQRGVNKSVIQYLLQNNIQPKSILDLPSGEGHFLRSFKTFFPACHLHAQDLYMQPLPGIKDCFVQKDVKDWSAYQGKKFDLITSISGVMVHDDLIGFIDHADAHLNEKGKLIITNDNILTIRDRISFLFLGRFRRFKKIYDLQEGNWNLVKIQSLYMLLRRKNFKIEHIQYTSIYLEDYIFLPFALIIFPIHILYLLSVKTELSFKEKYRIFPFKAFFARHYFLVSTKNSGV